MRPVCFLFVAILFVSVFSATAAAQVLSTIYQPGPNEIRVSFTDDIQDITLTNTLVFFEDDTGKIVQVFCDVSRVSGLENVVSITGFRNAAATAATAVHLARGGGGVPEVPAGKIRTYNIVLKGVRLSREPRARPIQTSVDVNSLTNKVPVLFVGRISNQVIDNVATVFYNREVIQIQPEGIKRDVLVSKFREDPGKIRISYIFSKDDLAPNVETSAVSIKSKNEKDLVIEPKEKLPFRARKYTVKIMFPADQLRGNEDKDKGFLIPADAEFLTATAAADLVPSGQTDRAKTEFFVETTYTSTVNSKNHARTNVGIFGIHWKPTLPLLTYNVFGEEGSKPVWMAFRPLLEADFDTQSPKVSKSPNRIQLGMDYELGRDAGLQKKGHFSLIQQHVWINGLRYDSDRDFKLQTVYWHTEYVPRFLNFEQTTEERQFAFDVAPHDPKSNSKGPLISSYRIKPSMGYELGGLVRRDSRSTNTPTDTISRSFFALDLALEFRRVIKFGVTSTYYYLANADRRRNRDYTESRVELNTGFLFNRNFNGLQNAIVFKFQRGEQPPAFSPVNALSLGFKIFR